MNNYQFCLQWVQEQPHQRDIRVLDYGCGAGHIVRKLQSNNITAFGCDVFYEGGDYSTMIDPEVLPNTISRMSENIIPFNDNSFDFIINNQVLEHVEDLDKVLSEINRVLKPGGSVLSLFPDKGVWREGHCGVPFLHWFPKKTHFRIYYAAAFRLLGFGYHKKDKGIIRWSEDFCEWLDRWTHYRSKNEVHTKFNNYFQNIQHIEDYWFQLRVGRQKMLALFLPAAVQKYVTLKLGCMIFVCHKKI